MPRSLVAATREIVAVQVRHHGRVSDGALARRLTTTDAVVVGLGAMLGAGVFSVFAPAAATAGPWLLAGLAVAAVVAFCNATSSAQLATAHPTSGGTYVFGRVVLGPRWGFAAGWAFVVGKTASCAAMALVLAAYALPNAGTTEQRVLAATVVVVLTGANLLGVTRTARVARVLLVVTLVVLATTLVTLVVSTDGVARDWRSTGPGDVGVRQVLGSAGLIFFAFAGYARIATLAEEVRDPRTLGRAVVAALSAAVVIYAAVGATLLLVLGPDLSDRADPLAAAVDAVGADWAAPVVRLGAVAACLGALLALLAGVSRTVLAMGRHQDLPGVLARVEPRHQVPTLAQVVIGVAVAVVVLTMDVRGAIGFSAFGVLLYYAVTNLAALRQPTSERRWPRGLQVLGLVGCLGLAVLLPTASVVVGGSIVAVGLLGHAVVRRPS